MKYKIGDKVTIDQDYINQTLRKDTHKRNIAAVQHLGHCGTGVCKIADIGIIPPRPDEIFFVRLVSEDTKSFGYRHGQGLTVYFTSQEHLDKSLVKKVKAPPKSKATKPKKPTSKKKTAKAKAPKTPIIEN